MKKVMWEGTDHWDLLLLEELPYQGTTWYCLTSVKTLVPIQKKINLKVLSCTIRYILSGRRSQSRMPYIRAKSSGMGNQI
jgi:hypothetical protein